MGEEQKNTDWRTLGHDRAVRDLQRSWQQGRLAHAYLLTGPPHIGKMILALDMARMLNCLDDDRPCGRCTQCKRISEALHADVRVIGLKQSEVNKGRTRILIGIDQVREVQKEAALKPYEGAYRVFIIDGAEQLSGEAANSLLKLLEEPPDQVVIILLAGAAEGLLLTIVSRCRHIELRPLPHPELARGLVENFGVDVARAEEIARVSGGRLGWAVQAAHEPGLLDRRAKRLDALEQSLQGGLEQRFAHSAGLASAFSDDRDSVRQELALWLEWWRDVMVIKEGAPELVTNLSRVDVLRAAAGQLSSTQITAAIVDVRETWDYLDRNINPRLALENLMLRLPRTQGVAA